MNRQELLKIAKPILFNTEMVQAILEGRKIVTRRVVKFPEGTTGRLPNNGFVDDEPYLFYPGGIRRPQYKVGDILYVRETWTHGKIEEEDYKYYISQCLEDNDIIFKEYAIREGIEIEEVAWKPSIHMPKSVARIFLKVTDVRVERLQDIREEQAKKEGIKEFTKDNTVFKYSHKDEFDWGNAPRTRKEVFKELWDSTIKKSDLDQYGWDANPWVWAIEFERMEKQ